MEEYYSSLASWLLSVPYLLSAVGFVFLAWSAGGYAHAATCSQRSYLLRPWYYGAGGSGIFLLVVRIAAGLAIISWISAVIGISGHFRAAVVFPVLLAIIILGLPTGFSHGTRHQPMLLQDRHHLRFLWSRAARPEKLLGAFVVLLACAMAVNLLLGGLVTDMNQDPMWYHLSLPQQWIFDQEFSVLPDVLPSAYPLAVESVYAVILMLKPDSVLCSMLNALCGLLLYVGLSGAALMSLPAAGPKNFRGWGLAAVVAIWLPTISVYGLVSPVQPKNDIITMLWTFAGAMLVWLPLLSARALPGLGWWAVAGFLLGTACSAKPPVLLIAGLALAFAAPAYLLLEWRQRGRHWPRDTIIGLLLCGGFLLLAMAPWMLRGWRSHGLPLFPLGRDWFPTAPEFQPLLNEFFQLHGIRESVTPEWIRVLMGLPGRILQSGANGERSIFLYIPLCIFGVLLMRGYWRWFALMLMAQLVMFLGVKDGELIYRLLAPAYCLAAPLVAAAVAISAGKVSGTLRLVCAVLLLTAVLGSVGLKHYQYATFRTINWRFRPVLSEIDKRRYASTADKGSAYAGFSEVRNSIDKEERVLLLGSHYPFYLHRDALWNDEAVTAGGIAERWSNMSVAEAEALLRDEDINMILYTSAPRQGAHPAPPVAGLLKADLVEDVSVPADLKAKGWSMYKVERVD